MSAKNTIFVASTIKGLSHNIRQLLPTCDVRDVNLAEDDGLRELGLRDISNAEILVTDPAVACQLLYADLPKLKWINTTWAGVEAITRQIDPTKPLPRVCITRSGQGFGQSMAEFVLCHMVAFERDLKQMYRLNELKQWKQKKDFRSLSKLTIGILGVGEIGREVARCCKMMNMEVWGLSRTSQLSEPCKYVDHVVSSDKLGEFLSGCDYVCSILPSTAQTRNMLSGNVLESCKQKRAVFINIGRGDVIDEESLVRAIKEKWLRGAILDVFKEEPLPPTSELWSLPNVTITLHTAAPSFDTEVADCFVKNYKRYVKDEPLLYVIDWKKGY